MAQQKDQGGLSVQTLIIASLASLTAAIVVHKIWEGGAILGAAITPIIVALTSEALRKPTQRITAIREERVQRTRATPRAERKGKRPLPPTRAQRPAAPPAPEFERPDPFGIWQDAGRTTWRDRLSTLDRRHVRLAVVTGLLAFVVGAIALTGIELVFGGDAGGDGQNTTLFGGGKKKEREREDRTTPTQPGETTPAAPQEEETPDQTPAQTTPTAPAETTPAPPAETAPAPEGGTPAPEEAPAPQTPAPTP